jgi:two-component system response regulator HydG
MRFPPGRYGWQGPADPDKSHIPDVPVIIITGYSDIKIAVEVIKHGAYDYVTKPLFPQEILITINKAINDSQNRLAGSTELPDTASTAAPTRRPILSESNAIKK